MNRKQKIIVSITGIFLVLMILVGLTYAYFLTKITGNTNSKSISVTTANLVLEYGENTNVVQGINNAEPGYSVEKIFTATNKGNSDVTYGAALESIVNELSRQEDLIYTLTCTSYLKEGFSLASDGTITGTVDGTCNGVSTEKQFPSTSTLSVMVTNTIDTNHTHSYKLTIDYKYLTDIDQSTDMDKTFSAKVNIVDINALTVNNPYKNDMGTLKKAIIDNAMLGKGTLIGSKLTEVTSISGENERVLNIAPDVYGTSYYFRGNVLDNFINYAGMCFRIVRIEGDGSIKMLLASEKSCNKTNVNTSSGYATDSSGNVISTNYGYKMISSKAVNDYVNSTANTTNNARFKLNEWIDRKITNNNDISSSEKQLLKTDNWCIGDRTSTYNSTTYEKNDKTVTELITAGTFFSYSSYKRINDTKVPTFICDGNKENAGEVDQNNVGLLTVDEIRFAGAYNVANKNCYLTKNATSNMWMSLSISDYSMSIMENIFFVYTNGQNASNFIQNSFALRPVITLTSKTEILSGDGTIENPYTVKISS